MAEYKVNIQKTIEDSFLTYAGHVIQDRSIPDVRDGLKLGARQLLYSQYAKGITHNKGFKKGHKKALVLPWNYVTSMVILQPMVHSFVWRNLSLYAILWKKQTQGNFGTPVAPDNHSASRYVELRASCMARLFHGT